MKRMLSLITVCGSERAGPPANRASLSPVVAATEGVLEHEKKIVETESGDGRVQGRIDLSSLLSFAEEASICIGGDALDAVRQPGSERRKALRCAIDVDLHEVRILLRIADRGAEETLYFSGSGSLPPTIPSSPVCKRSWPWPMMVRKRSSLERKYL